MISGKILKKAAAVTVAAMMAVMSAVPAFAADNVSAYAAGSYTYTAPDKPMKVDSNIITATAHRAASPILGMMGVNAVSGFGMINGTAPTNLKTAEASAALGIWGSSINSNPDPYFWNYFYNFYAEENNLDKSPDALMNPGVSGNPMAADTIPANDPEEDEGYKISVSLSKRPDIAVGCSTKGDGSDTAGYDEQLNIINNLKPDSKYYQAGDETYKPELVQYQTTTIKEMIASVHGLADAIEAVEKKTGKTTRYGDVQKIASDYEDYVYGIISYIREEIAAGRTQKKTVAIVTNIDGDTYEIADYTTQSVTSKMRAFEYSMAVTDNLYDKYKKTTLTKDELLTADAILTFDNSGVKKDQLIASLGNSDYSDKIIITNTPGSLYGMTMNSVENALGYAFTIGSIYNEVLNPVEAYAYFYEYLCHVTDRSGLETVVRNNFQTVDLPDGVERTLPADYSKEKIKAMLATGKSYYKTYPDEFNDDASAAIGLNVWDTDSKNSTVGSGGKISGFYSVNIAEAEGGSASASITNSAADNKITVTLNANTGYTASGVTVKTASGKDVAVTKNSDGTYTFTMPAEEVTVTPSFTKAETAMPYTDIVSGSWYYDAVKYVYEKNVMTGTSATTFNPNGKLTRAMLAQILYNNAGKPSAAASSMKDVSSGSWFASAVAWAAEKGVVTGYSDNSFRPNDSVTREQLAVMLYRYAGSPAAAGTLDSFTDASSVAPYAQDAVKWAVANGIITGNGSASTLDPKGTASRAQVAVMISRYLEKQQAQ